MSRSVKDILEERIKGLILISETDSIWTIFSPTVRRKGSFTCQQLLAITGYKECDDKSWTFDAYMQHLVNSQIKQSAQYQDLYESMYELLGDLKVFKVRIDLHRYRYYVVGVSSVVDGANLIGICADSVET